MPIEHEHASVSLKIILLVFAVILVGVLGYLVWDYNNTPDTTDYSSTTVKKTETTKTKETDETADWTVWTRTEQGQEGFTIKTPTSWKVYGADNDRETLLTVVDEKYTDAMYKAGVDKSPYSHAYFYFLSTDDDFTTWVDEFESTSSTEVSISGVKATRKVETDGNIAYYFDLTAAYGMERNYFLRAYYDSDDTFTNDVESIIKSTNFSPSSTDIKNAKQIP